MVPSSIAIANEPITRASVQPIWNGNSPERISARVTAPTASGPGSSRDWTSAAATAQRAIRAASDKILGNAQSPLAAG